MISIPPDSSLLVDPHKEAYREHNDSPDPTGNIEDNPEPRRRRKSVLPLMMAMGAAFSSNGYDRRAIPRSIPEKKETPSKKKSRSKLKTQKKSRKKNRNK